MGNLDDCRVVSVRCGRSDVFLNKASRMRKEEVWNEGGGMRTRKGVSEIRRTDDLEGRMETGLMKGMEEENLEVEEVG